MPKIQSHFIINIKRLQHLHMIVNLTAEANVIFKFIQNVLKIFTHKAEMNFITNRMRTKFDKRTDSKLFSYEIATS